MRLFDSYQRRCPMLHQKSMHTPMPMRLLQPSAPIAAFQKLPIARSPCSPKCGPSALEGAPFPTPEMHHAHMPNITQQPPPPPPPPPGPRPARSPAALTPRRGATTDASSTSRPLPPGSRSVRVPSRSRRLLGFSGSSGASRDTSVPCHCAPAAPATARPRRRRPRPRARPRRPRPRPRSLRPPGRRRPPARRPTAAW